MSYHTLISSDGRDVSGYYTQEQVDEFVATAAGSAPGQKLAKSLQKGYAHRLVMPAVYSYGKDTITLIPSPTDKTAALLDTSGRASGHGGGSLRYTIKPGLGSELQPKDVLELGLPGDAVYNVNA